MLPSLVFPPDMPQEGWQRLQDSILTLQYPNGTQMTQVQMGQKWPMHYL